MTESGGGTVFLVRYFDGEKEMSVGTVQVNPVMEYKPFQLILSQKIGISPNQISIYLVDKNKDTKLPFSKDFRRIPITGKVNFELVCCLTDYCFLAVLKRSRKMRNRKEKTTVGSEICSFVPRNVFSSPAVHPVPENLILLRRNQPAPCYDDITQLNIVNFNIRLNNLRFQRGIPQFEIAEEDSSPFPIRNPISGYLLAADDFRGIPSPTMTSESNSETLLDCKECESEKEESVDPRSFHACVRDMVITCSDTCFGPISPPISRPIARR